MSDTTNLPDLFYVDRSDRGRLRLTGRDRQSFLQGMVTNDVASLTPGTGCYAFQLDATGHVLADLRVLCAEDHLLLDVEPGQSGPVAERLEKYLIMERVRIADVTGETAQVFVGGAGAASALASLFSLADDPAEWAEGQSVSVAVASEIADARLAATRLIRPGTGFDVYLSDTAASRDALLSRLADAGAVALAPETLEALRLEAGVPRFGVDLDPRVLAPETGQQTRAIHYRKGCYIGQEIVARIDARGHTNRTLVGLRLDPAAPLPAAETPIVSGEGREVGRITSAAVGPTRGVPVALGYVRHESAEPGTQVTVGGASALVAALPFAQE